MLYKVGDKVTVRKDLCDYYREEGAKECVYFNVGNAEGFGTDLDGEMTACAGKVATITTVIHNAYRIDSDGERWNWLDTMFEETLMNNKYKAFCNRERINPERGILNERI